MNSQRTPSNVIPFPRKVIYGVFRHDGSLHSAFREREIAERFVYPNSGRRLEEIAAREDDK